MIDAQECTIDERQAQIAVEQNNAEFDLVESRALSAACWGNSWSADMSMMVASALQHLRRQPFQFARWSKLLATMRIVALGGTPRISD
jgi:hypothetical protein